jgi:RNA-directed DNA polymerase
LEIQVLRPKRETVYRLIAIALESLPNTDQTVVAQSLAKIIGRKARWINPVAKAYSKAFVATTRPTRKAVIAWLQSNRSLNRAMAIGIFFQGEIPQSSTFGSRSPRVAQWQLPIINNTSELCRFLDLDSIEELEWLIAPNKHSGLNLHHYAMRLVKKRTGGFRILESPRSRLKFVQRIILHEILDRVPPSDACFGFVKQRNVMQFASVHCGQRIVLRMDLEDFFPNIGVGRIHAMWRTLGYADSVATYLTWLCTVPRRSLSDEQWESIPTEFRRQIESNFQRDRLPQGAPTSGAIANLIAHRMDRRLMGLMAKTGGRYSRYADDCAFSWKKIGRKHVARLAAWIAAIAMDCDFKVNFRKTRIMHQSQRQSLAGIIVNEQPNLDRATTDNLRALLFNCVRFGPDSQNHARDQNFREQLRGRIAWIQHVKPTLGLKLMKLYKEISWSATKPNSKFR